jgi:HK97 family phage major capsid protein
MTDVRTIPKGSAELQEMLTDEKVMASLFKQPKAFGEFITNYAASQMDEKHEISTQVRNETQRVLAEFVKNQKTGVPINPGMNPLDGVPRTMLQKRHGLYNSAAPGAAVDKTFKGWAEFLRATNKDVANFPNGEELYAKLQEHRKIQNSFSTTIPADGGFLVPETMRSDLLQIALESAVVRPRATVIPMESLRVPIPAVDSTTNATSVFGGIVTYWTEEGAGLTESQAKFQQVVLEAKKLTAYCVYPNELPADASAFGAFLDRALPMAISFEEDYQFMMGTGVSTPTGFINCTASVQVAAVAGQGANTIIVENLAGMFARMLPSSLMNAVWIASIDTFPQLATLALQGSGTGSSTPVWMNNGVIGAPPISIYGRPVYFTEKASTLGTTGDINFVDPAYYLIGDRQTMQVATSEHVQFANDKTATRVIQRVDGQPWIQSAITPKNGSSNTLTPFVQLSSTRT